MKIRVLSLDYALVITICISIVTTLGNPRPNYFDRNENPELSQWAEQHQEQVHEMANRLRTEYNRAVTHHSGEDGGTAGCKTTCIPSTTWVSYTGKTQEEINQLAKQITIQLVDDLNSGKIAYHQISQPNWFENYAAHELHNLQNQHYRNNFGGQIHIPQGNYYHKTEKKQVYEYKQEGGNIQPTFIYKPSVTSFEEKKQETREHSSSGYPTVYYGHGQTVEKIEKHQEGHEDFETNAQVPVYTDSYFHSSDRKEHTKANRRPTVAPAILVSYNNREDKEFAQNMHNIYPTTVPVSVSHKEQHMATVEKQTIPIIYKYGNNEHRTEQTQHRNRTSTYRRPLTTVSTTTTRKNTTTTQIDKKTRRPTVYSGKKHSIYKHLKIDDGNVPNYKPRVVHKESILRDTYGFGEESIILESEETNLVQNHTISATNQQNPGVTQINYRPAYVGHQSRYNRTHGHNYTRPGYIIPGQHSRTSHSSHTSHSSQQASRPGFVVTGGGNSQTVQTSHSNEELHQTRPGYTVISAGGNSQAIETSKQITEVVQNTKPGYVVVGGGSGQTSHISESSHTAHNTRPGYVITNGGGAHTVETSHSSQTSQQGGRPGYLVVTGGGGSQKLESSHTSHTSQHGSQPGYIIAGGGGSQIFKETHSSQSSQQGGRPGYVVVTGGGGSQTVDSSHTSHSSQQGARPGYIIAGGGGSQTVETTHSQTSHQGGRPGYVVVSGGGGTQTIETSQISETSEQGSRPGYIITGGGDSQTVEKTHSSQTSHQGGRPGYVVVTGGGGSQTVESSHTSQTSQQGSRPGYIVSGGGGSQTVETTHSQTTQGGRPGYVVVTGGSGSQTVVTSHSNETTQGGRPGFLVVAGGGGPQIIESTYVNQTSQQGTRPGYIVTGGGGQSIQTTHSSQTSEQSERPGYVVVAGGASQTVESSHKNESTYFVKQPQFVTTGVGSSQIIETTHSTETLQQGGRPGMVVVIGAGGSQILEHSETNQTTQQGTRPGYIITGGGGQTIQTTHSNHSSQQTGRPGYVVVAGGGSQTVESSHTSHSTQQGTRPGYVITGGGQQTIESSHTNETSQHTRPGYIISGGGGSQTIKTTHSNQTEQHVRPGYVISGGSQQFVETTNLNQSAQETSRPGYIITTGGGSQTIESTQTNQASQHSRPGYVVVGSGSQSTEISQTNQSSQQFSKPGYIITGGGSATYETNQSSQTSEQSSRPGYVITGGGGSQTTQASQSNHSEQETRPGFVVIGGGGHSSQIVLTNQTSEQSSRPGYIITGGGSQTIETSQTNENLQENRPGYVIVAGGGSQTIQSSLSNQTSEQGNPGFIGIAAGGSSHYSEEIISQFNQTGGSVHIANGSYISGHGIREIDTNWTSSTSNRKPYMIISKDRGDQPPHTFEDYYDSEEILEKEPGIGFYPAGVKPEIGLLVPGQPPKPRKHDQYESHSSHSQSSHHNHRNHQSNVYPGSTVTTTHTHTIGTLPGDSKPLLEHHHVDKQLEKEGSSHSIHSSQSNIRENEIRESYGFNKSRHQHESDKHRQSGTRHGQHYHTQSSQHHSGSQLHGHRHHHGEQQAGNTGSSSNEHRQNVSRQDHEERMKSQVNHFLANFAKTVERDIENIHPEEDKEAMQKEIVYDNMEYLLLQINHLVGNDPDTKRMIENLVENELEPYREKYRVRRSLLNLKFGSQPTVNIEANLKQELLHTELLSGTVGKLPSFGFGANINTGTNSYDVKQNTLDTQSSYDFTPQKTQTENLSQFPSKILNQPANSGSFITSKEPVQKHIQENQSFMLVNKPKPTNIYGLNKVDNQKFGSGTGINRISYSAEGNIINPYEISNDTQTSYDLTQKTRYEDLSQLTAGYVHQPINSAGLSEPKSDLIQNHLQEDLSEFQLTSKSKIEKADTPQFGFGTFIDLGSYPVENNITNPDDVTHDILDTQTSHDLTQQTQTEDLSQFSLGTTNQPAKSDSGISSIESVPKHVEGLSIVLVNKSKAINMYGFTDADKLQFGFESDKNNIITPYDTSHDKQTSYDPTRQTQTEDLSQFSAVFTQQLGKPIGEMLAKPDPIQDHKIEIDKSKLSHLGFETAVKMESYLVGDNNINPYDISDDTLDMQTSYDLTQQTQTEDLSEFSSGFGHQLVSAGVSLETIPDLGQNHLQEDLSEFQFTNKPKIKNVDMPQLGFGSHTNMGGYHEIQNTQTSHGIQETQTDDSTDNITQTSYDLTQQTQTEDLSEFSSGFGHQLVNAGVSLETIPDLGQNHLQEDLSEFQFTNKPKIEKVDMPQLGFESHTNVGGYHEMQNTQTSHGIQETQTDDSTDNITQTSYDLIQQTQTEDLSEFSSGFGHQLVNAGVSLETIPDLGQNHLQEDLSEFQFTNKPKIEKVDMPRLGFESHTNVGGYHEMQNTQTSHGIQETQTDDSTDNITQTSYDLTQQTQIEDLSQFSTGWSNLGQLAETIGSPEKPATYILNNNPGSSSIQIGSEYGNQETMKEDLSTLENNPESQNVNPNKSIYTAGKNTAQNTCCWKAGNPNYQPIGSKVIIIDIKVGPTGEKIQPLHINQPVYEPIKNGGQTLNLNQNSTYKPINPETKSQALIELGISTKAEKSKVPFLTTRLPGMCCWYPGSPNYQPIGSNIKKSDINIGPVSQKAVSVNHGVPIYESLDKPQSQNIVVPIKSTKSQVIEGPKRCCWQTGSPNYISIDPSSSTETVGTVGESLGHESSAPCQSTGTAPVNPVYTPIDVLQQTIGGPYNHPVTQQGIPIYDASKDTAKPEQTIGWMTAKVIPTSDLGNPEAEIYNQHHNLKQSTSTNQFEVISIESIVEKSDELQSSRPVYSGELNRESQITLNGTTIQSKEISTKPVTIGLAYSPGTFQSPRSDGQFPVDNLHSYPAGREVDATEQQPIKPVTEPIYSQLNGSEAPNEIQSKPLLKINNQGYSIYDSNINPERPSENSTGQPTATPSKSEVEPIFLPGKPSQLYSYEKLPINVLEVISSKPVDDDDLLQLSYHGGHPKATIYESHNITESTTSFEHSTARTYPFGELSKSVELDRKLPLHEASVYEPYAKQLIRPSYPDASIHDSNYPPEPHGRQLYPAGKLSNTDLQQSGPAIGNSYSTSIPSQINLYGQLSMDTVNPINQENIGQQIYGVHHTQKHLTIDRSAPFGIIPSKPTMKSEYSPEPTNSKHLGDQMNGSVPQPDYSGYPGFIIYNSNGSPIQPTEIKTKDTAEANDLQSSGSIFLGSLEYNSHHIAKKPTDIPIQSDVTLSKPLFTPLNFTDSKEQLTVNTVQLGYSGNLGFGLLPSKPTELDGKLHEASKYDPYAKQLISPSYPEASIHDSNYAPEPYGRQLYPDGKLSNNDLQSGPVIGKPYSTSMPSQINLHGQLSIDTLNSSIKPDDTAEVNDLQSSRSVFPESLDYNPHRIAKKPTDSPTKSDVILSKPLLSPLNFTDKTQSTGSKEQLTVDTVQLRYPGNLGGLIHNSIESPVIIPKNPLVNQERKDQNTQKDDSKICYWQPESPNNKAIGISETKRDKTDRILIAKNLPSPCQNVPANLVYTPIGKQNYELHYNTESHPVESIVQSETLQSSNSDEQFLVDIQQQNYSASHPGSIISNSLDTQKHFTAGVTLPLELPSSKPVFGPQSTSVEGDLPSVYHTQNTGSQLNLENHTKMIQQKPLGGPLYSPSSSQTIYPKEQYGVDIPQANAKPALQDVDGDMFQQHIYKPAGGMINSSGFPRISQTSNTYHSAREKYGSNYNTTKPASLESSSQPKLIFTKPIGKPTYLPVNPVTDQNGDLDNNHLHSSGQVYSGGQIYDSHATASPIYSSATNHLTHQTVTNVEHLRYPGFPGLIIYDSHGNAKQTADFEMGHFSAAQSKPGYSEETILMKNLQSNGLKFPGSLDATKPVHRDDQLINQKTQVAQSVYSPGTLKPAIDGSLTYQNGLASQHTVNEIHQSSYPDQPLNQWQHQMVKWPDIQYQTTSETNKPSQTEEQSSITSSNHNNARTDYTSASDTNNYHSNINQYSKIKIRPGHIRYRPVQHGFYPPTIVQNANTENHKSETSSETDQYISQRPHPQSMGSSNTHAIFHTQYGNVNVHPGKISYIPVSHVFYPSPAVRTRSNEQTTRSNIFAEGSKQSTNTISLGHTQNQGAAHSSSNVPLTFGTEQPQTQDKNPLNQYTSQNTEISKQLTLHHNTKPEISISNHLEWNEYHSKIIHKETTFNQFADSSTLLDVKPITSQNNHKPIVQLEGHTRTTQKSTEHTTQETNQLFREIPEAGYTSTIQSHLIEKQQNQIKPIAKEIPKPKQVVSHSDHPRGDQSAIDDLEDYDGVYEPQIMPNHNVNDKVSQNVQITETPYDYMQYTDSDGELQQLTQKLTKEDFADFVKSHQRSKRQIVQISVQTSKNNEKFLISAESDNKSVDRPKGMMFDYQNHPRNFNHI